MTGTVKVTPIQGPIRVLGMGALVTVAIPSGANTLKFTAKSFTAGTATDLCTATDTASAAKDQLFVVDGTVANALIKGTAVSVYAGAQAGHMPIYLANCTLELIWSAGPPATGEIEMFMLWEPLAVDSYIPGESM